MNNIKDFTDLLVWKMGHKLVIQIYKTTETFPEKEKFGLVSQMRRAAVSVTSNITEGFGRKSAKEKIQFYYIANGSITEVKNQLLICRDVQLITKERFLYLLEYLNKTQKLLYGLIKSTKKNL